ncbi:uncharacterized protein METZ01_LOCUS483130, partial [marine metagenome]
MYVIYRYQVPQSTFIKTPKIQKKIREP